jgi:NADP-dependent 3-hydroxy acid dehydrogenase YdfG
MEVSLPTESRPGAGADRTAVVAGAASGMGLAVAERFLAEGHIVVGVDRDAEALSKAAASHGPAYHPVIADIANRATLSAALGPHV